ncbi:MetQ/NlpA family ABC transporter substrate-binding protein [Wohlfahrtiimonas larvae]|uniref:MetQ/NlpA family ABC transporter substrate-binding protein n=1 Tax=Wohlfahrtiimonas larvae TaxID=1157986 RepID=A0ABP9MXB8_9GAMM|nr:MetQ/NlpA family ABC transporter substrate-binding protein [Wohlfahrtiimonas larvae]
MKLNGLKVTVMLCVSLIVSACGNQEEVVKTSEPISQVEIKVGFGPSNYADQFKEAIQPILERKGYKVTPIVFSQNPMITSSMRDNEIDASISQSYAFMLDLNRLLNMDMMSIGHTATAPQSLRSTKHQSLDEVEDGMLISLSSDSINMERGARILESLGWVKINDNAKPATFSLKDIEKGQYDLRFIEVDPAQSMRSMDDVDFAVVNGNYVVNMGQKITDGLYVEKTPDEHRVIVTIQSKDKDQQWAKDLAAAYASDEFRDYILSKSMYEGFIMPKEWNPVSKTK